MSQLNEIIKEATTCLDNYKPDGFRESLNRIKDIEIESEIIQKAFNRKTALGFFGESQVGKSYLVSRLLYNLDDLEVRRNNNDDYQSFIKNYVSDSGQESTAVVTRFTKDDSTENLDGYLLAELLGPGSLLYSIYLGYHLEYHSNYHDAYFTDDEIWNLINSLDVIGSSEKISKMVLKDFKDGLRQIVNYTRQIKRNENVLQAYDACWNKISNKDSISYDQIKTIIKIIFFEFQDIQDFIYKLFEILKNRNFPEFVFLPEGQLKNMLTTKYMMDYSEDNDNNRINLKFNGIHEGSGYPIMSENQEGTDLFWFQVLSKELTLYVGQDCSEIFETVDVLDFPGIRSFADKTNIEVVNFSQDQLNKLAKSGKLRFLFYDYTKNLDVTYLAFCDSPDNITADHLKHSLQGWVDSYSNENNLDIVKNSLFTIFTKTDISLSRPELQEIWASRFQTLFLNEFNWAEKFTAGDQTYKNLYLIYNPNASTYELPQDLSGYHNSFINDESVDRVLADNKEEKWQGLINGDGGIEYLHNNINDIIRSSPDRKEKRLNEKRSSLIKEIRDILSKFYVDPDLEEHQNALMDTANEIINKFKNNEYAPVSIFLNYCKDCFPLLSKLDIDEGANNGFIPPTPSKIASELYKQYMESFKINLKSGLSDLMANNGSIFDEFDENDLTKMIDTILNKIDEDEEIMNFISDFAIELDVSAEYDNRKIFRESLYWIVLGHFSDLWSEWSLGEVNMRNNTEDFSPFLDQYEKWEKEFPKLFSSSGDGLKISGGNKEIGVIIERLESFVAETE
tara:strand:- start:6803 stop:9178 length:2376 start_codon:yes stop_codon:yes gene_type:complete